MVKPEWGIKRLCQSCGARYYDFLRTPIVCPSCGTTFDSEAVLKSRRARPLPADDTKPKARKEVVAEVEDVDDEEEEEEELDEAELDEDLDEEDEEEAVDPAKRLPAVDVDADDEDEVVVDVDVDVDVDEEDDIPATDADEDELAPDEDQR